ncbi:recombinase family protein [Anaerococcus sp. AGMB00486]|uniref:Recombinase family protein n=1 Tax=Anaerococcus faecalis TaxID=2742993 RepID=A0ABX2NAE0_9FIRM|nr:MULTISPECIES: recombinase family protein [Anaerococcus]MDD7305394.1 recombinase family protein [Peptoniphilaceae bacterium]MDY3007235.1 recombinase family protein [Anaerococcus porci]NVF11659.1 recombinase family protein [Anaerococcus faecalis]
MKRIQKIEAKLPTLKKRKRVAAYARVSVAKGRTLNSLSQQVSYYNELITANKDWEFAGVYSDLGTSGATANREQFQEMLKACEDGKIDLILTKSISRFARNTVDLLEIVRHLKLIGVEVHFEKENIKTFSGDGELMLSILASFAQEEARSISNNVKWGIRKNFEKGKGNSFVLYGYRWDGEKFNLVEEEAEVIRYCFQNFLDGKSAETTARELQEKNIKGLTGNPFSPSSIRAILRQEKYTGNSKLQKTYTDFITKREIKNQGELPMYWTENTHPKIIELDVFNKVQEEMARRRELGALANRAINTTCLTSKIHCSCGRNYQRNQRNQAGRKYAVWMCAGQKEARRNGCINPSIPEYILKNKCAEVLGIHEFDEEVFTERISDINVLKPGLLEFIFKDGHKEKVEWKSTAKKDRWTDEVRLNYSKKRSDPNLNRKISRYNEFTSFVKCEKCGKSYRRQKLYHVNGDIVICYYCSSKKSICENSPVNLSVLEELTAKELGLKAFDKDIMIEKLSHISINDYTLTFHYKDGKKATYKYENPISPKPKHSEETKKKMSKIQKELWRQRHEKESNSDTGN